MHRYMHIYIYAYAYMYIHTYTTVPMSHGPGFFNEILPVKGSVKYGCHFEGPASEGPCCGTLSLNTTR